jgi:hypothetical protein
VSHEGERILFVHQWRFAGGWSGPSRRGGCRGWGWRFNVCRHPHSARQAWSAHASRRAAATGPPAP